MFPVPIKLIRQLRFFLCLSGLLILSACNIQLISHYDETTDKTVTALQKKMESHLLTLEAKDGLPECVYSFFQSAYQDLKVDASAIAVRAAAIPKNELTAEQTRLLGKSIETLEQLHQIACISKAQIAPLRMQFNASFTAILKLELAKRRGA
ncbi:MAG: hypothetical protein HY253_01145 [Burkholderiales bacterium]|nr:hypothetical protein [Burkholderiales bacterium]